ncbi:hypothetical protein GCM10010331_44850 [Streptomyces xanthochromogenes]|uniref:hypothetical protein n=1 Tax=Streptomyces xanthochromogenes TaxID=67384 RepID=UPI001679531D|nr:hypothetical protein [Streptomyces xanthochromogenes]GHB52297.1 hypothetical protein GCM10010331_44850 [Streptomyces xanthochromogenes]
MSNATLPTPAAGTDDGNGQTITVAVPPQETPRTFTEDDLNKARQQEREKLYGRLEAQDETLKQLKADLDARETARKAEEAAAADAIAQAEKEAEEKRRRELSAKSLLAEKETEWETKLASLQAQIAERDALAAKERQFNELQQYQAQALAAAADEIAPELHDLVRGNTREEIDASLAAMKAKSAAIVQSLQAAQTQARAQMQGTQPTGYGIGPGGSIPDTRQLTVQEINDMDMSQFGELRKQLGIGQSANSRGLFG